MSDIRKIENEIKVLEKQKQKLEEETQNKRIRKATQKRYPELDLTWFSFADKEISVCPEGSPYAGQEFSIYGIKNKIRDLKKKGILRLNKYGCWATKFTREEAELFYKEVMLVCGYLLFPCFRCGRYYQLKDLYIDKYGYYENQSSRGQLITLNVSRCKKCSDEKVKEFNVPHSYNPPLVNKGGRWKGTYKLSDSD